MSSEPNYFFDRRTIDSNGHMHVPNCRITKASVDKYLGSETSGSVLHGFGAFDEINIYRDGEEIAKALSSFDTVPLMIVHEISTAADPKKELLVGAVTNPRWEYPYLYADITVWDQAGIDLINSGEQAELSAGYSRDLDWTPGKSPDGLQYDARMFNIKCNHVALVRKGRVDGAVVADKAPEVSMFDKLKHSTLVAALFSAFGVSPKEDTALALDAALDSELSKESEMTADEKAAKEKEEAEAKEKAEREAAVAMDAKINEAVAAAVKTAVEQAEARVHGLYAAKAAVADKVGDVSLDSAEAVYRFALTKIGVEHEKVVADALPALWESSNKPSGVSLDAARHEPLDITALFPGIGLIRKG